MTILAVNDPSKEGIFHRKRPLDDRHLRQLATLRDSHAL
jgi:hypothetical protein